MVDAGRLGTPHQMFIPWMQATYIMAADRRALPYLPEGASLDAPFSTKAYLAANPDVAALLVDPLAHDLAHGGAGGPLA